MKLLPWFIDSQLCTYTLIHGVLNGVYCVLFLTTLIFGCRLFFPDYSMLCLSNASQSNCVCNAISISSCCIHEEFTTISTASRWFKVVRS